MPDVWSALAKGCVAFSHSHVGKLTGGAFKDTGSLVTSLADNSPPGTAKTRLQQLKDDIKNLADAAKPVIQAVEPEAKKAKDAVVKMAAELGTDPFTWEAAGRAATELAYVFMALDAALDIIAKKVAEPEPTPQSRADMENSIRGIREPWVAPFRSMGAGATNGFDALCKQLLHIDNAGKKFADQLNWSRDARRLGLTLATVGPIGLPPLNFDGISIEAFFDYKTTAKVGVALHTKMRTGLRSEKLLEKIIPDDAPNAQADQFAVTLDTKDGLTFGDGPNRKIVLPVRFSFPGIELREMAIARPPGKDENSGRIDLMVTIAGKLGEVLGVVAEGGGVIIRWKGDAGAAIEVLPKPPYAAGLRVKTGLVTGGGYLRYKEEKGEYGGVLDLKFTSFGVWAAGLIVPDPFSFVLVMGVHFLPKIELSFGFTLNGVGGLIAINRRLDSGELRKGLREGAINQIIFPDDPIAAAPKMLDRLGAIFPPQPDAFVVGPIAELGWGSQTGFVRAKLGIILALPDPKVVILGTMQIVVPSPDAPPALRIVDLRLEVAAEFTPDYVWIGASLVNSKIAAMTVTGDFGLLIRWNGGAAFALSAGGFFPKFTPPPEMEGMRRLAIEISPPIDWLKIRAEAYFAITSNSVQFGGKITLTAELGPVGGKAWIGLDALFQWSPRFYFIFLVDCGIEITAFDQTIAGVSFHGELSGMKPWHLEGHAKVTILFWDVPLDVGPIEWGDRDETVAPPLSPAHVAAAALTEPIAWKPQLPAGADSLARFTEDTTTPLLVHPLGALEVKQIRVPLETEIDRIGSSPVTSRRIHLVDPKVGSLDAAAVSHAKEFFAPGHFRNLTEDQQNSRQHFEEFPCGMKVAASKGAIFGAPMSVVHEWETVYPHENFERYRDPWKLGALAGVALNSNAVAFGARQRANPYLKPVPEPVEVAPAGAVRILRRDDMTAVAEAPEVMTTTAAASRMDELADAGVGGLQLVNAGSL